MDADVRAVDPYDETALAARHSIAATAGAHDIPDFPPLCPVRFAGHLRHPGKANTRLSWLGYLDGEPAGVLDMDLPQLDNLANAVVELRVAPQYRRRGVGRTLYQFAIEAARREGRVRLLSDSVSTLPDGAPRDPAGDAFARAMGATLALTEVRRRLDLSTVDLGTLAGPVAPGYSTVHWGNVAPDGYLADLARLERALENDAPRGDLAIEVPEANGERVRDAMESHLAAGWQGYHGAVRHEATGALVAWTTLGFEPTVPDHAWQFLTVVDPAHRGHRLGLGIKLANLRHALGHMPGLRMIDTWNAASNSHMIAINEALGFRPVDAWSKWQHEFR
jgi:GNAT superfamily N-acetyltransferase